MSRNRLSLICLMDTLLAGLVAIGPSSALAQQVLRVPSEYPTIQAGIDAAQTNDTVLVAPGSYSGPGNSDLNFNGKAITVSSESGMVNLWGEHGQWVIRFRSGESASSVFWGFRINPDFGENGIEIVNSSPTIVNCLIGTVDAAPLALTNSRSILRDTVVDGVSWGSVVRISGGAPRLERFAVRDAYLHMSNSDVVLVECQVTDVAQGSTGSPFVVSGGVVQCERCEFSRNITGDFSYGANGGAVRLEGTNATFSACVFADNRVLDHQSVDGAGGGVFARDSTVLFENCEFRNNQAGTLGGGVHAEEGVAEFRDCRFAGNRALLFGGGALGGVLFADCVFVGNTAGETGGGATSEGGMYVRCQFLDNQATGGMFDAGGAGLQTWYGHRSSVVDSLFARNTAHSTEGRGGGLLAGPNDLIRGCTFVDNVAEGVGGAVCAFSGSPSLANCIAWGNTSQTGPFAGSVAVQWSNVQGGYEGEGNIDADPRFVDPANGDYRLGDGSPCIDAGNNALVPPESEFDLDGLPRFVNDFGMPNMGEGNAPIVDMGCYEFQSASTGLNLALRSSCPEGGPARIGWANASPDRTAVLLISPGTGTIRIPNRYPCAGTQLGLASSGLRIAWQGRNDAGGGRVINATAPPGACGQFVQLLDISTCNVSAVKRIE